MGCGKAHFACRQRVEGILRQDPDSKARLERADRRVNPNTGGDDAPENRETNLDDSAGKRRRLDAEPGSPDIVPDLQPPSHQFKP